MTRHMQMAQLDLGERILLERKKGQTTFLPNMAKRDKHMGTKSIETAPLENVTAAAIAGDAVAANGGGDFAVFEARDAELVIRRNADIELAAIEKNSALRAAEVYERTNRKGTAKRKRENAERDYNAAVAAAHDSYYAALDEFAITGGFLNLVNHDNAVAIVGRKLEKAFDAVVNILETARAIGQDVAPTPSGRVWNVAEMLELLGTVNAVTANSDENEQDNDETGNVEDAGASQADLATSAA